MENDDTLVQINCNIYNYLSDAEIKEIIQSEDIVNTFFEVLTTRVEPTEIGFISCLKFNFEKIIIVHDELDLPFGAIRFKVGGSSAGHRGIASLDEETQKTAIRVRLGINNNSEERKNTAEFVLSQFNSDEMKCFDKWISLATDAILALLKNDWQKIASTKSQKSALGFCQNVRQ